MTAAEVRHNRHMEAVYAVQRRSALERVLCKISYYHQWEREAKAGIAEPMSSYYSDQLEYHYEMRDALRKEMRDAGQIP